ncbi:hypothetical protein LCGC14_2571580 [marine sediment metagenome]|uniref:Uncharacterized protein n=1 Tax=marine sediment metagenome TaxID=412755 RepID=A0A0F9DA02_9ZZZZ
MTIVMAEEIHFPPNQRLEHKQKVHSFVREIEAVCRKYGLAISATDVDGMCIYDSEIEGYTFSIGTLVIKE